ncbi:redoxin domain-containing protein [Clostridium beijerinckii]|uniref:Peroxiredoxin n=1 Tax=Clostridium beijerinckii TaxID=1520 RepID=A0A1S9N515_CLOBE|nr:redoxin domain-containing protein [Clostridium beijerinckii]MZK52838.1 redoxin domain-containing protein [Clostridium beijerinckii]MZK60939.1 redoxin domain-containing protein [Clostridium beijerinckii]MZK71145.1 redoxin domain-containing protein [Clostridium beijerinckii]MZK76503.1 redoxin domain-containing protein [Clostridium beijerinckii]MZK86172.1 redoxin domain-containing protein [Clostridium beijerinckii]
MTPITIGADAPDFKAKDNKKQDIKLSDFKGKKVLLSWHPLAWTPVCTDQMRALETNFEKFQNLNTVPFGFSVDSQPCKEAWATVLQIKNVSLPSDFWPHGKIASDYGIFDETKGISGRANIIINEDGKVQWIKVYPSEQLPDINEVLQVLSNNQ